MLLDDAERGGVFILLCTSFVFVKVRLLADEALVVHCRRLLLVGGANARVGCVAIATMSKSAATMERDGSIDDAMVLFVWLLSPLSL